MIARAAAAIAAALVALAATTAVAGGQEDGAADRDHLVLVSQTPWVAPGGTYAIRLRVDDPPPGAEVRWTLHRAVRNRTEFTRSLDGNGLRTLPVDRDAAADPVIGGDGSVEIRIPTGAVTGEAPVVSLGPEDEGIYPVLVELVDGDGERLDGFVTHLLRLPDEEPDEFPLEAAVVLPLHAPPSHVAPGEIDAADLAVLDAPVDVLAERPEVAATLVPTPEAVAALAEIDPAAGPRLAELAAGRQVLGGPWVRVDTAAWRRAGLGRELEALRTRGDDALEAVFGRDPDHTTAVVEPGGGQLAVAAATVDGARRFVVAEEDLEPLSGDDFPLTLTRPFEIPTGTGDETAPALVADAALAGHVGATGDPVLDAHHLLADLAVLALDAPASRRTAVVALDDDAVATTAFLDALLAGLDQPERVGAAPLVVPVTVDDAFDDIDPAADPDDDDEVLVRDVVTPGEAGRAANVGADLAAAAAEVASYRSVFGDGDGLALEVEELAATAVAGSLDADARRRRIDTGIGAMRAELDDLHAPARQRVTLTARDGQVQVILGNDTGRPADVTLELRGDRLEFPAHPDNKVLVRLAPGPTRVDLDVRARSSGDARLDLRLMTPDGRVELGASVVTVRTTAVSGVGIVLMVAAAAFLVVWWTRTIVRERRSGRAKHPAHARGAPG